MSRKLVFVFVFLAALPVLMISAKARGDDPPTKQSVDAGEDPFGRPEVSNPFGRPEVSKPAQAPRVDPHKVKADLAELQVESSKPKPSAGPVLHGGEKAILKALNQETSLDFIETPLKDVLDYLSRKHRIPIRTDVSSLKEAGVNDDTPITCKLSGIPLRSALEIILDELQLKWAIHHDVLMIISPAKAESDEYMYTKLYDVTDLLATAEDHELQNPISELQESAFDYSEQLTLGSGPGN